jgi:glycerol-3-phosphate acyltransferase PlsY
MILSYGLLVAAYIIGAIPFSVIFGKAIKGIDVRNHGSGNPGGTNSLRFLGIKVGTLVIIGDVSKGAIIIVLMKLGVFGNIDDLLHPLAYGFASAFGHSYSIFIHFKGGKAVGTSGGAILAFNPLIALISLLIFLLALKLTRYVSLGSTSYGIGLIVIALVIQDYQMLLYASLIALLIFYRHITNYKNIKNKVEPKINWMSKKEA